MLIFEPKHSGHRLALYMKLILEEAKKRKIPITLITSRQAFDSPICQTLMNEYTETLNVRAFAFLSNSIVSFVVLFYLLCTKAYNRKLLVLTLDPILWVIPLCNFLGSKNIMSIHLKTYRILKRKRKNILFKVFLRACVYHRRVLGNVIFTIDPVAKRIVDRLSGDVVFEDLSDPFATMGYTVSDIKSGKADVDCELLVYGSINKTKAASKAIEFAMSNDMSIVVAGKQTRDVKKNLAVWATDVTFYDYFLEETELANLIRKSNIIWLGYEGSDAGSSGVLHTSVYLQKQFLVRNPSKYIRDFCSRYPTEIQKIGDYQLIRVFAAPEEILKRNQRFQEAFFA